MSSSTYVFWFATVLSPVKGCSERSSEHDRQYGEEWRRTLARRTQSDRVHSAEPWWGKHRACQSDCSDKPFSFMPCGEPSLTSSSTAVAFPPARGLSLLSEGYESHRGPVLQSVCRSYRGTSNHHIHRMTALQST